jgi:cytochrome c553
VKNVKAPPATGNKVRYGEYLANIAHCMECHTQHGEKGELLRDRLGAGGLVIEGPWGKSVSRNLTPHESGLKSWTDAQIAKAVREGVDRNGNPYRPPMAFEFYKNISDADMAALIAYLRSLKPVLRPARADRRGAVTCTACRRAGRGSISRPGPSRCPGSSTRARRRAWRRR